MSKKRERYVRLKQMSCDGQAGKVPSPMGIAFNALTKSKATTNSVNPHFRSLKLPKEANDSTATDAR
jgi:hypothetical protein